MTTIPTKNIGVLTSGGDCAGLNATIRAVVLAAAEKGWGTYGILNANGLLDSPPNVKFLTPEMVNGAVLRQGGTMLGTSSKGTFSPLAWPQADGSLKDRSAEVLAAYNSLNLQGLVVIGGDGSMGIFREIAARTGLKFVGIPKTIDNDVGATDVAVGFDTAVAVATEALDRLQPTAASHQRVMILEVMGRDAGHIALNSGIAGGADIILIPEIPYKLENITKKIKAIQATGRSHALMVVSEAVKGVDGQKVMNRFADGKVSYGGVGHHLSEEISNSMDAETRVTVLGHVQRGSSPTHFDRLIASAFGAHAVDLLSQGITDQMVVWQNRQVTHVPLAQALDKYHEVDVGGTLVATARALGISLGDR